MNYGKINRCVSEFEALSNMARNRLLRLPLAPKRRSDLFSLGFQNIDKANKLLEQWFGIELFSGVSLDDQRFLNIMFNRRHVFTHKGGQIDKEYVDNTGDTTVRVHEVIRFRSKEIRRLIPLIKTCSENLLSGLDSMK